MAEHRRGDMDVEEHQKTYEAFLRFWVYLFSAAFAILVFLALFNS